MKKIFCAIGGLALLSLTSCNLGYKTTKSGIKYKVLSGKAAHADTVGVAIAPGDVVKFQFKYTIPEHNDTVIANNYDQMPGFQKADTSERTKLTIFEIMPMLKSGDSAELSISVDSILQMIPAGRAPQFLKKGQTIKATVSILNVFKNDSIARLDVTKEEGKEKIRVAAKYREAQKDLDKYIKDKGIKAIKTPQGVYVAITTPGDISQKADTGTQASVLYTGKLLNGKIFDSNLDSTFAHYHAGAFDFPVGQSRAIQGWDIALPYFGKGGKGTIYIPTELGYGARAQGGDIPAFSNLAFDIEVQDVKKASAAPTAAPSQMTPEMQKQLQEQIKKQMQAQQQAAH